MTFDIGSIVSGVALILVVSLLTRWYSSREKRKRNEKKNSSQEIGKEPIAMQSTYTHTVSDIVSTMYVFFDEMGVPFELTMEEDSVECFTVVIVGRNGDIMMRVNVMADRNMYQIIAQQKTFITESNKDAAIRAINRYNMQSNAVSGYISEEGTITFRIDRFIDGEAFSIESFDREFSMVLSAAEDTTNQILEEASAR